MHAAVMTATSSVEDVFAASGSELVSRLGPRNGLPNIWWCTSAAYASKISKPATKRRSWAASRRPWCNVCFARSLCTQAHEQKAVLPAARRGASASSVQRRHAAAWIDAPDRSLHAHAPKRREHSRHEAHLHERKEQLHGVLARLEEQREHAEQSHLPTGSNTKPTGCQPFRRGRNDKQASLLAGWRASPPCRLGGAHRGEKVELGEVARRVVGSQQRHRQRDVQDGLLVHVIAEHEAAQVGVPVSLRHADNPPAHTARGERQPGTAQATTRHDATRACAALRAASLTRHSPAAAARALAEPRGGRGAPAALARAPWRAAPARGSAPRLAWAATPGALAPAPLAHASAQPRRRRRLHDATQHAVIHVARWPAPSLLRRARGHAHVRSAHDGRTGGAVAAATERTGGAPSSRRAALSASAYSAHALGAQ
eukprot:scaffold1300_cov317-Prasinococcus_capsulatus_cf.AAC.18